MRMPLGKGTPIGGDWGAALAGWVACARGCVEAGISPQRVYNWLVEKHGGGVFTISQSAICDGAGRVVLHRDDVREALRGVEVEVVVVPVLPKVAEPIVPPATVEPPLVIALPPRAPVAPRVMPMPPPDKPMFTPPVAKPGARPVVSSKVSPKPEPPKPVVKPVAKAVAKPTKPVAAPAKVASKPTPKIASKQSVKQSPKAKPAKAKPKGKR